MSQLGIDLRAWFLDQAAIAAVVANRVHQTKAPQKYGGPYLWFSRSGTDAERTLDQAAGDSAFREYFDVEAIGEGATSVATLADAIRALDCFRGNLADGAGRVQAAFVNDHSDDYVPRGVADDSEGLDVAAFTLEIVGYAPAA